MVVKGFGCLKGIKEPEKRNSFSILDYKRSSQLFLDLASVSELGSVPKQKLLIW